MMSASNQTRKNMPGRAFLIAVVVSSSAIYAQTSAAQTSAAPSVNNTSQNAASLAANGGKSSSMNDQDFVREASQGGLAEVQLGQLAVQKSSSDDVKQFAQKMVDDHTSLNNQMKPIADSLGVTPATKLNKKNQAEYDKLNGLSGADFDKEYLAFMDKDHHKDLKEFRAEEASTTNPDLKAAVTKGTDVIKEHTDMVDKLAKDKGVPVPAHKGAATSPAE